MKGRLDLAVTDLGPTQLKNIAEPVRAYSLEVGRPAQAKPASQAKPPEPKKRSMLAPLVAGIVAVIVIAGGVWYFLVGSRPAQAAHLSIVVLPFANLSNDPSQDYFADGVTENLTTDLSRIRNSFVIARNTAFTFKGKNVDAKEIGKELGVRYVLEGSVQRDQNRVRINAQLIDAGTGAHLWADRFEQDLADLFKLQDQVVARLANELGVELVNAEASHRRQDGASHVDADDLRLQGSALLNRGYTRENVEAAIKFFDQALAIDTNNTDVLVGLGDAIGWLVYFQWNEQPREQELARGLAAIDRALASEPKNAVAHMAKGTLLIDSSRHDEAIAEYDTAISIDPNLAVACGCRGMAHFFLGRSEETFADEEEAMRLSPHDPILSGWYRIGCAAHVFLAQDEAAIEWRRKSAALEQNWVTHMNLASAYGYMRRLDEARSQVAELLKLRPNYTLKNVVARERMVSENPMFLAQVQTYVEGLRRAGLPEE